MHLVANGKGKHGSCPCVLITMYAARWAMALLVPWLIKVKPGYHSRRKYNGESCCCSSIKDPLGDILASECSCNNLNPKCHSRHAKAITQHNNNKSYTEFYQYAVQSKLLALFMSVMLKMKVMFLKNSNFHVIFML